MTQVTLRRPPIASPSINSGTGAMLVALIYERAMPYYFRKIERLENQLPDGKVG